MALMDPYGLEMFTVEQWGIAFAVASTGFIAGGAVIAKTGLGRNPLRTMLLVVMAMGLLGALFTIRERAWLYLVGIWLYMALSPRWRPVSRPSSSAWCPSSGRGACSASLARWRPPRPRSPPS